MYIMLSSAFLILGSFSVRLQREVFEKIEECTYACKLVGPSCGNTETCYCGICSASDLCAVCDQGKACIGDTCYSGFLYDEHQQSSSLRLTDSDCECENGEVCYWGICIDTSEGFTDDEDDPCYDCEHCWFGSYCLDPIEDSDECNSACESVECSDGTGCYCGECISDDEIEDTTTNSSVDLGFVTIDRTLMFGVALAFLALFFAMLGYLMYKNYIAYYLKNSASMKKKLMRPGVKKYGRMNHPSVTPSSTRDWHGQYRQHSKYNYSASSSAGCSTDEHILNTRRVGRPHKDRTPTRDQQASACSSPRKPRKDRTPTRD